jgi:dethiobiotin synthetase
VYKGVFVTGTDTGVGKTYIAAALAEAVKKYGMSVGVLKPISTGNRDDAKRLMKASRSKEPIDRVNPVHLKYSLAPMMAARLSGEKLDLAPVWDSWKHMKKTYEFTIVEGVGGVMVPLKKNMMIVDMIKKFSLPVVVVARPYLGTINHTLLTVDKLQQKGLTVAGIILSCRSSSTLAEKTNPEIIEELTGLPVLEVPCKQHITLEQNLWLIGAKQS